MSLYLYLYLYLHIYTAISHVVCNLGDVRDGIIGDEVWARGFLPCASSTCCLMQTNHLHRSHFNLISFCIISEIERC